MFRLFENYHYASYPKHRHLPKLAEVVAMMDNATVIDGVAYHINRYGDGGLYGVNDPAERIDSDTGKSYKDVYPELQHQGTALLLGAYIYDHLHGHASCYYPAARGFNTIENGGSNRKFDAKRDKRMMK